MALEEQGKNVLVPKKWIICTNLL